MRAWNDFELVIQDKKMLNKKTSKCTQTEIVLDNAFSTELQYRNSSVVRLFA